MITINAQPLFKIQYWIEYSFMSTIIQFNVVDYIRVCETVRTEHDQFQTEFRFKKVTCRGQYL